MKKLSLTLDELKVESFVAGPAGSSIGTVRAHNTVLEPDEADAVAAPPSWNTECPTPCFTCDRMCPSGYTGCYTGNAPNCCV
jgi:hypothetical protein